VIGAGCIAIRNMTEADAQAVLRIYEEGINTGHATFASTAPGWEEWDRAHISAARLVAESDGEIAGWVALSAVSSRCVYRGVAEISVYVSRDFRGRGVGRRLLEAAVTASEEAGIWTLLAKIFPENEASLALHLACGFTIVGTHRRLGRMTCGPEAGKWRDVVLLERRSKRAGT